MHRVLRSINRWHSLKSKADGLRGMAENVRRGYRAGGIAPYGYRLVYEETGAVREGRAVKKSRLEIDAEAAPIVAEYFSRRSRGEGRKSIAIDFNSRGILSPRGGRWQHTTLRTFEDAIQTYLGHLVWNRSGAREKGIFINGRWKDSAEWKVNRDTHPAIISEETAEAVMRQRIKLATVASKSSSYLLTGTLFCGSCGSPFTGGKHYYRCSGGVRYGTEFCSSGSVAQAPIEREIQRAVKNHILVPEFTSECIRSARRHLRSDSSRTSEIPTLEVRLKKVEKSIQRWVAAFESDGDGWHSALERIKALEAEKEEILSSLSEIQNRPVPLMAEISDKFLLELLERFEDTMSLGDIHDRRELLGKFVERIEISKRTPGTRTRELIMEACITPRKVGDPSGI